MGDWLNHIHNRSNNSRGMLLVTPDVELWTNDTSTTVSVLPVRRVVWWIKDSLKIKVCYLGGFRLIECFMHSEINLQWVCVNWLVSFTRN